MTEQDVYDILYEHPNIVRIKRTFKDTGRVRHYQYEQLPTRVKQILQTRIQQLDDES